MSNPFATFTTANTSLNIPTNPFAFASSLGKDETPTPVVEEKPPAPQVRVRRYTKSCAPYIHALRDACPYIPLSVYHSSYNRQLIHLQHSKTPNLNCLLLLRRRQSIPVHSSLSTSFDSLLATIHPYALYVDIPCYIDLPHCLSMSIYRASKGEVKFSFDLFDDEIKTIELQKKRDEIDEQIKIQNAIKDAVKNSSYIALPSQSEESKALAKFVTDYKGAGTKVHHHKKQSKKNQRAAR